MNEGNTAALSKKGLLIRFVILLAASCGVGISGVTCHFLTADQAVACGVFVGIIIGTLFFWNFRLAVAFLGLAVLMFKKALNIPHFVESCELNVILFLVGMMVVVGALRDLGFFTWIVQMIVSMPKLSGWKFVSVTALASALLACAVDEVTSIIFVSTLIFQVSDRLKLDPTPYILIAVLCTNVGSAGTMMGNPVGILIGSKGHLSFGDFMMWAFPMMLASLLATLLVTLFVYRKALREFDVKLKARLAQGLTLVPVIRIPYKAGLTLLVLTVLAISSHHQLETLLDLDPNTVLYIAPLICAGVVMICKPERARHYIENEVDWWTLLFFMMLFAVAGTLTYTGVDQVMAKGFSRAAGSDTRTLVPIIFASSALGSAFVDNVIFVASFCPVIDQLSLNVKAMPLWWALLFGACFGGNITMIGSTANIVALGMLEKHSGRHMTFFRWLKVGVLATLFSGAVAVGGVLLLGKLMPDHPSQLKFEQIAEIVKADRSFDGKTVELVCLVVPEIAANGKKSFRMTSALDPEQTLTIPAEIGEKLLSDLGEDSPTAPGADRKWKYVVRGSLYGDKDGLRLEVDAICRRSKMKK
ncbi:MAG: hypothetical protein J6Y54_08795, partial [Lentisphaeria bacterium]|nr:hypothetical protein [Lentisphaeria bacterium]